MADVKVSALNGIIERLETVGIQQDAVDEISALLGALQTHGWSGLTPADEALTALLAKPEKDPLTVSVERLWGVEERPDGLLAHAAVVIAAELDAIRGLLKGAIDQES